MKKTMLIAAFLGCALSTTVLAGPRTCSQAKDIALKQAKTLGITVPKAQVRAAKGAAAATEDTAEPYYVFDYGAGQGYVIVAGDDELPDIVGYSTKGSYDETTAPEGLQYLLGEYARLSKAVSAGETEALKAAQEAKALRASSAAYTPPHCRRAPARPEGRHTLCPGCALQRFVSGMEKGL